MKNFLINTIIFVLVLSGALLVGWHFIQENVILYYTQIPIEAEDFNENLAQALEEEDTREIDVFDLDAVSSLDAFDWLQNVGIADDLEIGPIGELIMPTIDIRLPVFHGIIEPNISIGAGTLTSGMIMGEGNFVLGSHWDPNPGIRFGGLDRVQVGDMLILRDSNYLYIYETIIGDNYIINPDRWDITDYVEGNTWLTLFTCTPDGTQRVLVRGEFVEKLSVDELRTAMADAAAEDQARLEAIEELEALQSVVEVLDVEILLDVVETLDETTIPFPTVEVAIVAGGSLFFASLILWIANAGSGKKKK